MKTGDLIHALAADARPLEPARVARRFYLKLAAGAALGLVFGSLVGLSRFADALLAPTIGGLGWLYQLFQYHQTMAVLSREPLLRFERSGGSRRSGWGVGRRRTTGSRVPLRRRAWRPSARLAWIAQSPAMRSSTSALNSGFPKASAVPSVRKNVGATQFTRTRTCPLGGSVTLQGTRVHTGDRATRSASHQFTATRTESACAFPARNGGTMTISGNPSTQITASHAVTQTASIRVENPHRMSRAPMRRYAKACASSWRGRRTTSNVTIVREFSPELPDIMRRTGSLANALSSCVRVGTWSIAVSV